MVEVCNLNHRLDPPFGQPGDVRIDRNTRWGNPFIMYYQKDRDLVCDKYEKYFQIMQLPVNGIPREKEILVEGLMWEFDMDRREAEMWVMRTGGFLDIRELKDARRLGCHCFPYRCHGDYLKRLIEARKPPEEDGELWFFKEGKDGR